MFNVLFDCELIKTFPRKSWIPWTRHKRDTTIASLGNVYKELGDNRYLIKVRPKVDVGMADCKHLMNHSNYTSCGRQPPSHWLLYFLFEITFNGNVRFLPLLDKWHPRAAVECVWKGLVPVYMLNKDITVDEIIPIFNSLLHQKDIMLSNFVVMADAFRSKSTQASSENDGYKYMEDDDEHVFKTTIESDDIKEEQCDIFPSIIVPPADNKKSKANKSTDASGKIDRGNPQAKKEKTKRKLDHTSSQNPSTKIGTDQDTEVVKKTRNTKKLKSSPSDDAPKKVRLGKKTVGDKKVDDSQFEDASKSSALDDTQVRKLNSVFEIYDVLTKTEYASLGREVGLPRKVVETWFRKKAAKKGKLVTKQNN